MLNKYKNDIKNKQHSGMIFLCIIIVLQNCMISTNYTCHALMNPTFNFANDHRAAYIPNINDRLRIVIDWFTPF